MCILKNNILVVVNVVIKRPKHSKLCDDYEISVLVVSCHYLIIYTAFILFFLLKYVLMEFSV